MRSNIALLSFVLYSASALAQPLTTFSSNSSGADGSLTYAAGLGTVYFPPSGVTLHTNNIYNFTTITIGQGTTVRLSGWIINGPGVLAGARGCNDIRDSGYFGRARIPGRHSKPPRP